MSEHVARLVASEIEKRSGIETELIDIAKMPLPTSDAGEAIKEPGFAEKMERADANVMFRRNTTTAIPAFSSMSSTVASRSTFTRPWEQSESPPALSVVLESFRICSRSCENWGW
jgi:hypothetical protein